MSSYNLDDCRAKRESDGMTVGVLAFQGDFAEHIQVLQTLGTTVREVRSLADMEHVKALIIPGGESTVIAKFLESTGVGAQIIKRVHDKTLIVYGTCAGAIVLAKHATGKHAPTTLGLIDIDIERNAYGSQIDSFVAAITVQGIKEKIEVSFIRAPMITRVGKDVTVLATHNEQPVLVQQGNILAGTCHPEVRGQTKIHEMFLRM